MHLNLIDIANVANLNICQRLERRRRTVQLVLVTPESKGEDERLKLPSVPRRKSLGGHFHGDSLHSMLGAPCPTFGVFSSSSAPFLPLIVPNSSSGAVSSVPFFNCAEEGDGHRLLERRSGFSFASPQLPPLFLSKGKSMNGTNVTTEEKGDDGTREKSTNSSAITSVVSSSRNSRALVRLSPLGVDAASPRPISQPTTDEMINEEETTTTAAADVENSLRAFARAQEKLAKHKTKINGKLDIVSCHRMAAQMIDQLLTRLYEKCHSPQSVDADEEREGEKEQEKGQRKRRAAELTIAEVQKDFFPYMYAKTEQLLVDRRMTNASYFNDILKSEKSD